MPLSYFLSNHFVYKLPLILACLKKSELLIRKSNSQLFICLSVVPNQFLLKLFRSMHILCLTCFLLLMFIALHRYTGPLLEEEALNKAVENGLSSPEFFDLCVWLGSQIKPLCNMEESITPTDGKWMLICWRYLVVSGFSRFRLVFLASSKISVEIEKIAKR